MLGKTFADIFTKEVHNRLEKCEVGDGFRMNLETMELENIPKVAEIPVYETVIYSIKKHKDHEYVVINDFLTITFPKEWLKLDYDYFMEVVADQLKNN